MTRIEFNNTVRDLISDNSRPCNTLAVDIDAEGSGFANGAAIAEVDARQPMPAHTRVAPRMMAQLMPAVRRPELAAKDTDGVQIDRLHTRALGATIAPGLPIAL